MICCVASVETSGGLRVGGPRQDQKGGPLMTSSYSANRDNHFWSSLRYGHPRIRSWNFSRIRHRSTSSWQINFTNPPSVNIFLTTLNVPYITIRTNSLSSLELALHFISLLWKRLSSNLWILFSANKKNSFTPWRFPKPLELSLGWPVQRFDEVQITSSTNDNSPFLSPKPFLIGHCFNQWDLFSSVYKPVR